MNMTYSDVNLNQSQMVYQDFTDQQMLQDEFYGRNQTQHEDIDFLDAEDDDGFLTELNNGNGRLGPSSTLSYIPGKDRQQNDLLNASVIFRESGSTTSIKQPVL